MIPKCDVEDDDKSKSNRNRSGIEMESETLRNELKVRDVIKVESKWR